MRVVRASTARGTEERRVHKGHVISAAGHLGLIVWVLVGGSFAPAPEPFEVTEVAVISGEEFAAMVAGAGAPQLAETVAPPEPPKETEVAAPEPPKPEVRPEPPKPEAVEPPAAETAPEAPPPQEQAEVTDAPPVIAPPPQETVVLAPETSDRPAPRPVPRVAPVPVAQPDPDVKTADAPKEAVSEEKAPDAPKVEEQDAAQQEEATTEIVTEAAEKPAAAPVSSIRPKTRPAAAKPAEKPAARDAVKDALAEALAGAMAQAEASGTGSAPSGPPMTAGEKDALRVAVQQCWNVGALSSEALRVTVTVGVEMFEDGKPNTGSIRMIGFEGGSDAAAGQAYEAARRAIIRCGSSGFQLPREKYDHWREIEMVFNPEKMRIK